MFPPDGIVISISLQVEFTESLTMMSGLFAVLVLLVLNRMSHMMVMLPLLCITVSGLCSYHLSLISISWSLQMLQWRYAAALLCLEMYSVYTNTSHPDTIWSTVFSYCEHTLQLLFTCLPHITFWWFLVFVAWSWAATSGSSVSFFRLLDNHFVGADCVDMRLL